MKKTREEINAETLAKWQEEEKKYKAKISETIEKKGLCSYMNNTKWRELVKAVKTLPFPPPYAMKTVNDEEDVIFEKDVNYWGVWGNATYYLSDDIWAEPFYAVEYIKVRPRYTKHVGVLVPDVIAEDVTAEFLEILQNFGIPYEEDGGTITIYGYRKV